jgi:predicted transcriptional regulator
MVEKSMKNTQMRRGKIEIYIDVLRVVKTEHSPTWIMTLANTSWRPINEEIFPHLIKMGLISESGSDSHTDKKMKYLYHLTAEGNKVLTMGEEFERKLGLGNNSR